MNEERETPPQSEEEIRARLEEELKRIQVRDVVVQTVVTLVNLGGQRLGLSEATKEVRDPEQTRLAIEAVRVLLPLLEAEEQGAAQVRPVRDALAQLQLAYAREVGPGAEEPAQAEPGVGQGKQGAEEREQPPRPRPSGRLWVPPGSAS